MTLKVYGLAYLDEKGAERIFYCGITDDYERRWREHDKAIRRGKDPKYAYFHARRKGADKIYMVELDPDGEFTESEWCAILVELGHPLQNVAGGRKKRA
jgi:hypothetical protein